MVINTLLYYILSSLLTFILATILHSKDLVIALSVDRMSRPHYGRVSTTSILRLCPTYGLMNQELPT